MPESALQGSVRVFSIEPPVSLGLPVYNGEAHLRQTLDAILAQTYRNFSLIISDNASTDATRSIAQDYARRDARITYFRNYRNLGAGPNYNLCFHRSSGSYFGWIAHDDILAPTFLERCVAALEERKDAVFCSVKIGEIDDSGKLIALPRGYCNGMASSSVVRRFAAAMHNDRRQTSFFSLFRRDVLARTGLHGLYGGSDQVMVADALLNGPAVIIPEVLFYDRNHQGRLTQKFSDRAYVVAWWDSRKSGKRELFHWRCNAAYLRLALGASMSWDEKFQVVGEVVKWSFTKRNARRLIGDVLWGLSPSLLTLSRRLHL